MKTPYDMLGISPNADEKTIAIAFRKAAKHCHPDVNPADQHAAERFKQISAARDALDHPAWRALYQYLHLRRHHDRLQWIVTIASCIISAVVSGGLVSFLQTSMPRESITAAVSQDVDSAPHHFELISPGADMVHTENDEALQVVTRQDRPPSFEEAQNRTAKTKQNGRGAEFAVFDGERVPQQLLDSFEEDVQQTTAQNPHQLLDILEEDVQLTDGVPKASKGQPFSNCHGRLESGSEPPGANRCVKPLSQSTHQSATTRHSSDGNHKRRKSHIASNKDIQ